MNNGSMAGVSHTTRRWSANAVADPTLSRSIRQRRAGAQFLTRRRLNAGTQRCESNHAFDFGGDGPGTVALGKGEFLHRCPTQSAARGKQRDGLDQIGFAGAIGAGEHHRSGAVKRNLRGVIAAEVGQRQTSNKGGGHRYSSCRPCAGRQVIGQCAISKTQMAGTSPAIWVQYAL